MKTPILDTIQSPQDLKTKNLQELHLLCQEIRSELIRLISQHGGHLGANLGVVEMTIALLYVFDFPEDKLIFDVGHQSYVYKLLTGRRELMENLRQENGACGFQNAAESSYDCFGGGHAGTAISAGLGLAVARDINGKNNNIISIVGDGAFACGTSLEGMNIISESTKKFILIINDNKLSIAANIGAWAKYLNTIISSPTYNTARNYLKNYILHIPKIGIKIKNTLSKFYKNLRHLLIPPGRIFNELGLRYFGPLDGHDLTNLIKTFNNIKNLNTPVILHILTQKGNGYEPALKHPELYHGVGPFDPNIGVLPTTEHSFSNVLGKTMFQAMQTYPNLITITAGTCSGNGLIAVRENYKDRYFDVGIAEEHALVFAAGLAVEGKIPVVSLYATFAQRALDYVFHDICLQNLPVILCLDRAGIVNDGPTHHGIQELGFWRAMPNLNVLQPADDKELEEMLLLSIQQKRPTIIRYPKSSATTIQENCQPLIWGKAAVLREGKDGYIWGNGREAKTALQVAKILSTQGLDLGVINPRFIMPLDKALLHQTAQTGLIISIDNHVLNGGFSDYLREGLENLPVKQLHFAWPNEIISWGNVNELRHQFGLTAEQIAKNIQNFIQK